MARTIEQIAELHPDEPINSPVILEDIQQHLETLNLDPIDAIYVQSKYFRYSYNLGLAEMVNYAHHANIDIPFDQNDSNFFKILRTVIYHVDEGVRTALLDYNTPNVHCREQNPDTGEIKDIITMERIDPRRMVTILEPDGVHGNCFDIVSITEWLTRDTGYVDDLEADQPVREYTNPATNEVISEDTANQILANDKAWWVAYLEEFDKNVPYIPEPQKPQKYQKLFNFADRMRDRDIIDILSNGDSYDDIKYILSDIPEVGWFGIDEVLARLRTSRGQGEGIEGEGEGAEGEGERENVNYHFGYGYTTLLHIVISHNLDDAEKKVIKLLGAGAQVNAQDEAGHSPLIYAIDAGEMKIVELLIMNGADVNLASNSGHTPLMAAAMHDDKPYARYVAELLIAGGANVNAETEEEVTALILGAADIDIARMLINNGAKVNVMNTSGRTPLSTATSARNMDVMKLLIDRGFDVNARDVNGVTTLMKFSHYRSDTIGAATTKFLIDNQAKIDLQDDQGYTALMRATQSNNTKTMNILISHRADMHLTNINGQTAMDIAIAHDILDARILLTTADLIISMRATGLIS